LQKVNPAFADTIHKFFLSHLSDPPDLSFSVNIFH